MLHVSEQLASATRGHEPRRAFAAIARSRGGSAAAQCRAAATLKDPHTRCGPLQTGSLSTDEKQYGPLREGESYQAALRKLCVQKCNTCELLVQHGISVHEFRCGCSGSRACVCSRLSHKEHVCMP